MFYPPVPSRALTARDLLKFGAATGSGRFPADHDWRPCASPSRTGHAAGLPALIDSVSRGPRPTSS